MRILHLAPRFPFPEDDGGKISMAADLKMFSKLGCEVEFVSINSLDLKQAWIEEAEKHCNLHLINYSSKNTKTRIAKSLLHKKSLYIHKHLNHYLIDELTKIIKTLPKIDIIHCEHSCMAPLGLVARELTGAYCGIRLQNVEYKIWKRYAEDLSPINPKGIYVKNQAKKLLRDEAELYEQADISFAITDIDKKAALDISPNANVVTATAGIFPERWTPDTQFDRNPYQLIIATTYNWIHNITGLQWFIDKVLPKIRKQIPQVTLSLIGKNPPQKFYEYQNQGVEVLGYIPEVQPFLNKAGIYIAPLFTGSGIRIKILEAMAMEMPVVATHVSAEGIKAGESNGLFVSDQEDYWVDTICKLIKNQVLARNSGIAARKKILESYTWETNVRIMVEEYASLNNRTNTP
jgi:glycosyltransferase involved in cell wall biosynthesis